MKTKHIAMVMASALLTVGLVPLGSAQDEFGAAQQGIEVITVVGKRPAGSDGLAVVGPRAAPEGIEVVTVVGKRPEPTVASTCVNEVMAGRVVGNRSGEVDAQTRQASRISARQAIKDCIEQAQVAASHS